MRHATCPFAAHVAASVGRAQDLRARNDGEDSRGNGRVHVGTYVSASVNARDAHDTDATLYLLGNMGSFAPS